MQWLLLSIDYVSFRGLRRYLIKRHAKCVIFLLRDSPNSSSSCQDEQISISDFNWSMKSVSFLDFRFSNRFILCQFSHCLTWYNFSIIFHNPLCHFISVVLGRAKTDSQSMRREWIFSRGLSKIYPFKPTKLTYIWNVSFLTKCCKVRCLYSQLEQIFRCHICDESSYFNTIITEEKKGIFI